MATETHLSETPASLARTGLGSVPSWFPPLLFAWITGVLYCAFFVAPPAKGLGAMTPILYLHVPMAWNGGLGLILAAVYSGIYLKTRRIEWDAKAVAANELGMLYCVLATIAGSIWARGAWGVWWNWDPKESSILILLLLYGAYFALRSGVETRPARATLGAAYSILSAITVPLLLHIIPFYLERMGYSAHPYAVTEGQMDPRMLTLLLCSTAGFLGLYIWMFRQRVAIGRIIDEEEGAE
jgi:heme exporter protein C